MSPTGLWVGVLDSQNKTPSAPRGLALTGSNGDTQISLSWNTSDLNVISYIVQYSTDSTFTTGITTVTDISTTSATITGLTSSTSYWFRVAGVNSNGLGVYSSIVNGITLPGVPTGLATQYGYQNVLLTWTAPTVGNTPITDYIIQKSPDNSTWSTVTDGISVSNAAIISGFGNNETIYFRVASVNSGGTGSYTAGVVSVTQAPSAQGGNTITYQSGQWAHRFTNNGTFTPSTNLTASVWCVAGGFNGENGVGASAGYGGAGGSGGQVVSTSKSVTANTGYSVTLGAVNGGTTSVGALLSATGAGVTGGARQTTTPAAGNNGTNGITITAGGITNIYGSSGGGGARGTIINQRSGGVGGTGAGNGGGIVLLAQVGDPATEYGCGGGGGAALSGASGNGSSGGAGKIGTAIISYNVIGTPNAVAAPTTTPGTKQVALTWTAPTNGGSTITSYILQYATNSQFTTGLVTTIGIVTTSTTVTGLTSGSTYWFRIIAVNAVGISPLGTSVSAVAL